MSAVNTKDMPMVMGTSIFFALIFSVVIILVDLCGAWMDPRIRAKFVRS